MVFFQYITTGITATYPVSPQIVCPFETKRIVLTNEEQLDLTKELYVSFDGVNDHGHLLMIFTSMGNLEYRHQQGTEPVRMWIRCTGTGAPLACTVTIEH